MSRNSRKLQSEVDTLLKKVKEEMHEFDDLFQRCLEVEAGSSRREKMQSELKRDLGKLQRRNHEIKHLLSNNDVRDTSCLDKAILDIQAAMGEFWELERGNKTKAYSNRALAAESKRSVADQAMTDVENWLVATLDKLGTQREVAEFNLAKLSAGGGGGKKKGKKAAAAADSEEIELRRNCLIVRSQYHSMKLEQILRLLRLNDIEPYAVTVIRDEVDDYVTALEDGDDLNDGWRDEDGLTYDAFELPDVPIGQETAVDEEDENSEREAEEAPKERKKSSDVAAATPEPSPMKKKSKKKEPAPESHADPVPAAPQPSAWANRTQSMEIEAAAVAAEPQVKVPAAPEPERQAVAASAPSAGGGGGSSIGTSAGPTLESLVARSTKKQVPPAPTTTSSSAASAASLLPKSTVWGRTNEQSRSQVAAEMLAAAPTLDDLAPASTSSASAKAEKTKPAAATASSKSSAAAATTKTQQPQAAKAVVSDFTSTTVAPTADEGFRDSSRGPAFSNSLDRDGDLVFNPGIMKEDAVLSPSTNTAIGREPSTNSSESNSTQRGLRPSGGSSSWSTPPAQGSTTTTTTTTVGNNKRSPGTGGDNEYHASVENLLQSLCTDDTSADSGGAVASNAAVSSIWGLGLGSSAGAGSNASPGSVASPAPGSATTPWGVAETDANTVMSIWGTDQNGGTATAGSSAMATPTKLSTPSSPSKFPSTVTPGRKLSGSNNFGSTFTLRGGSGTAGSSFRTILLWDVGTFRPKHLTGDSISTMFHAINGHLTRAGFFLKAAFESTIAFVDEVCQGHDEVMDELRMYRIHCVPSPLSHRREHMLKALKSALKEHASGSMPVKVVFASNSVVFPAAFKICLERQLPYCVVHSHPEDHPDIAALQFWANEGNAAVVGNGLQLINIQTDDTLQLANIPDELLVPDMDAHLEVVDSDEDEESVTPEEKGGFIVTVDDGVNSSGTNGMGFGDFGPSSKDASSPSSLLASDFVVGGGGLGAPTSGSKSAATDFFGGGEYSNLSADAKEFSAGGLSRTSATAGAATPHQIPPSSRRGGPAAHQGWNVNVGYGDEDGNFRPPRVGGGGPHMSGNHLPPNHSHRSHHHQQRAYNGMPDEYQRGVPGSRGGAVPPGYGYNGGGGGYGPGGGNPYGGGGGGMGQGPYGGGGHPGMYGRGGGQPNAYVSVQVGGSGNSPAVRISPQAVNMRGAGLSGMHY